MAKPSTWVVTGDGSRSVASLATALQGAGAAVSQRLDALGIVIVAGSKTQAAAWRKLPGVAAVEADAGVDIGPPDAGVS